MVQPLRVGMWVKLEDRVGILASRLDELTSEVHLVDDVGDTAVIVQATNTTLSQATFMDIPERRRPNSERARRLGY